MTKELILYTNAELQLFSANGNQIEWLVDDLIPAYGCSVIAGAPKCGKSTMARQIAAAMTNGEYFLGHHVKQGKALILATQEAPARIIEHFRKLGCPPESFPYIANTATLTAHDAAERLDATLESHTEIKLVVVDMIVDLLDVVDFNDYSKMAQKLRPLMALGHKRKVQLLCIHHAGKNARASASAALLGSTALAGGVDNIILLGRDARGRRFIKTECRYGEDMDETMLDFNPERQSFRLGESMAEAQEKTTQSVEDRMAEDIVMYLRANPGRTMAEIWKGVNGRHKTKSEIVQAGLDNGTIVRTGTGKKGNPYIYSIAEVAAALMEAA